MHIEELQGTAADSREVEIREAGERVPELYVGVTRGRDFASTRVDEGGRERS